MTTVLIIDSDDSVLLLLEVILRRTSNTVLRARTGIEGLAIAEERLPDIILLDNQMPRMAAEEICYHLRNQALTRHIPIILISAALIENVEDYTRQIRADGYLPKPFLARQVEATLNAILQG